MSTVDVKDGVSPEVPENPQLDKLRTVWLSEYLLIERNLAPATARSYDFGARVLERFTGRSIFEVTKNDYRAYVRASSHSDQHKGTVLSALKSAHRFYCLEMDEPMNGISALSSPRVVQGEVEPVSLPVAQALLQEASHPLEKRLVFLGLYCSTRISEACDGEFPHRRGVIDWCTENGGILIYGKGRKLRENPIHPELAAVLEEIRSVDCTDRRMLEYRVQCLRPRVGFFKSHGLRARFSRQFEEKGVTDDEFRVVQSMMGHAGTMTDAYSGGVPFYRKQDLMGRLSYA